MKKIFNEFKAFAIRGNVIDMAIGIVVGTAFNKIVSSLVNDVIMPVLGAAVGKVSLSELSWNIAADITVSYGKFLQFTLDFVIIALAAFSVVKIMNSLKDKAEDAGVKEVPTPKDIQLLSEIRDLLKEAKK